MPPARAQTTQQLCISCREMEREAVEFIARKRAPTEEELGLWTMADKAHLRTVEQGAMAGCPCCRLLRFCYYSAPLTPGFEIPGTHAEELAVRYSWFWKHDRFVLESLEVKQSDLEVWPPSPTIFPPGKDFVASAMMLVPDTFVCAGVQPFGAFVPRISDQSQMLTEALKSTKLCGGLAVGRGHGQGVALGMHHIASALSSGAEQGLVTATAGAHPRKHV